MKFKMSGFDELDKKLDDLQENARKLKGKRTVTFEELFTREFMERYTKYDSIVTFFEESPFEFDGQDEFNNIDDKQLNKWIRNVSEFHTWNEMQGQAVKEYTAKQLGL